VLVSHRKKFIFLKTSKTAGTSVEAFFERHCVDDTQWECKHHRDESVSTAGIVGYRGPKQESAIYYNHMSATEFCTIWAKILGMPILSLRLYATRLIKWCQLFTISRNLEIPTNI
jgi:hypothetical protein